MNDEVRHPLEIVYGGGTTLSCAYDGGLKADERHGFFAGDTRVLSTYRFAIAGHAWRVLLRTRAGPSSAQWDLQNPWVRAPGGELPEGTVHCRILRHVSGALHDDLTVTSYMERPVPLRLTLQLDADFSDVFEVADHETQPRLAIERILQKNGLSLVYERRGFRRALHVTFRASAGALDYVGAQVVFDLVLEPRQAWRCCLEAVPELDGRKIVYEGDPHADEDALLREATTTIRTESLLARPFEQSRIDLERLAIDDGAGGRFIAAGAPWFLTLFGRDTLVASLMAGVLGSWHTAGALTALGTRQAERTDDFRDAQPGKIAHELRVGELARFDAIPHTPYYGTHDAPALYVLALWNAFRFTGDRELLRKHLESAKKALRWCEEFGDEDGDGLLEYGTRSRKGYRNQGWKDSEDAIPGLDGVHAELPIATVELQGYWYAARLAMAELLEITGEPERADRERKAAEYLRRIVEECFWMEDEGTYALALDGHKRAVQSVASNAGHLLWCGLPTRERALRVARRFLASDMFTGYGLRTLSAVHRSYNPLSYQLGSVWPHDTALFAAGLFRYGFFDEGEEVVKAILDAAAEFEHQRLPELFCGFDRDTGPPVPYERANVPQAWAAAAPILAAQLFLGLLPDAARGVCHLAPRLPKWLPELEVSGIDVAGGALNVKAVRQGSITRVERVDHPTLRFETGTPEAPLWGAPFGAR